MYFNCFGTFSLTKRIDICRIFIFSNNILFNCQYLAKDKIEFDMFKNTIYMAWDPSRE